MGGPHLMDWFNLDLSNPHERAQSLLDPIIIEDFLLEAVCNLPEITAQTLGDQFLQDINTRVREAIAVFQANLPAFVLACVALREKSANAD